MATIARLVDGNGAEAADVILVGGDVQTRATRLSMTITLSWASANRAVPGNRAVAGSRACADHEDVQAYLAQACREACLDLDASRREADRMLAAPTAAYATFQDGYAIGSLPCAAHAVEECTSCSGDGRLRCTAPGCAGGWVDCIHCGRTGTATCHACGGRGSLQNQDGSYSQCGRCNGSGRAGTCQGCHGQGRYMCGVCHGSALVRCGACQGTGCFTRIHTTSMIGRVARSLSLDADAPAGFRLACEALDPAASLERGTWELARPEVSIAPGRADLVLHCQTFHVHVDLACKGSPIAIDALGPDHAVPRMPPFLDRLLADTAADIAAAVRTCPGEALQIATRTRLTRAVLADVGRGRRPSGVAVSRSWKEAVSESFAGDLAGGLERAYAGAARSSVRSVWLLCLAPLCLEALLANVYGAVHAVMERVASPGAPLLGVVILVLACQALVVLPAAALVWLFAARRARRRLQRDVGGLARRGPRQGVWPALCTTLAMATGFCAAALSLDAARMGLPFAAAPMSRGNSVAQAAAMISETRPVAASPAAPALRPVRPSAVTNAHPGAGR